MGQRYWAVMIKRTFLALIVIFIAGIVFDYLTNSPENRSPMTSALAALAIYFVTILILGFLNAISGALYLWLFAESDLAADMLDQLRQANLPAPKNHHPKTHQYLAILADDETADPNDRVKAAVLYGGFQVGKGTGIFRSLALTRALDSAVLRYSQEAPER